MEEDKINEYEAESQADRDAEENYSNVTDLSKFKVEGKGEDAVIRITK